MKVYNWIDSFFNTQEKRRNCLHFAVCLFWLMQYFWQLLFFYALFQVQDYTSLFAFMEQMGSYTSSILVKVAYTFITIPTASIQSFLYSVIKGLTPLDLIFLILTILWMLQANRKKLLLFAGANMILLIVIFGFLMAGMQSTSIAALISLLHVLAIVCLLFHIVLIGTLFFIFIQHIVKRTIKW